MNNHLHQALDYAKRVYGWMDVAFITEQVQYYPGTTPREFIDGLAEDYMINQLDWTDWQ